jgi:hypothetical protein
MHKHILLVINLQYLKLIMDTKHMNSIMLIGNGMVVSVLERIGTISPNQQK